MVDISCFFNLLPAERVCLNYFSLLTNRHLSRFFRPVQFDFDVS